MSEKEVICIVLAYDYNSPYRQFPEDERKRRAKAHVYGTQNEKFFTQPKVAKATELYMSLQFDPRRQQIIAYRKQLQRLDLMLGAIEETDLKKLKDIITSSKELRNAITEIESEIIQEEESEIRQTEDNTKLSFLEKLVSNKQRYEEVTSKNRLNGVRNTS